MKNMLQFSFFLINSIPNYIQKIKICKDEINIQTSLSTLPSLLLFVQNHNNCLYNQLVDICAVDLLSKNSRFRIFYSLLSLSFQSRIMIYININLMNIVPSVTNLFKSANWLEREVWDMFGVFFSRHPDLRRILTDYGFEGYPLRKDFPQMGFVEVRYDDQFKHVLYEPVELAQEFRFFNFLSPWIQVK